MKLKYNNLFANKLVSMRLVYIILYVYMYKNILI